MTRQRHWLRAVEERLRRVMALHFDPAEGSAYWLDRAAAMGFDPAGRVERLVDLELLGAMSAEDLCARPLKDYVPRRFHRRLDRLIVGQTGGTTGGGTWTAYVREEFEEAFVLPFVAAAGHVGFPAGETWLYVGPSGPHLIGKVVRHLANALGSPDPFSVDFDSRWAKRLPGDSFASARYVGHVVDQAMAVIERQEIGVLFTTPVVLGRLAGAMSAEQRDRIRGVHYGGMAISPGEMERFQRELFPRAVHLSGYGNTLFGCCLELTTRPGREPTYFPFGHRLFFEIVGENGTAVPPGVRGRVRFTRLDESMLIVRMVERDEAVLADPAAEGPADFAMPGVRNPSPAARSPEPVAVGLY